MPNGPLTSRLQHIQPGDTVLIGRKPTGTLLIHDLHPGRNLYLLGTGTGLAPWLAVIKDPETYERFDKVILCHGVRNAQDLAYRDYIVNELPHHEFLGEQIARSCSTTRRCRARTSVQRPRPARPPDRPDRQRPHAGTDLGLEPLDAEHDRAMICGSPQMLADFRRMLDATRLQRRAAHRQPGQYVFERAFVEK